MKKLITIFSVLIGIIFLAGCISTSNNITTTSDSPSVSEKQNDPKEEARVEVVSHKEKKSQYGASSIVGEVINNGNAPASFVKVTATFYDANGEVVDTGFTYAGDTSSVGLEPSSKAPFEIVRIENIKFNNYKLDVTWND